MHYFSLEKLKKADNGWRSIIECSISYTLYYQKPNPENLNRDLNLAPRTIMLKILGVCNQYAERNTKFPFKDAESIYIKRASNWETTNSS